MADERAFPPVDEPVDRPARYSQSFLSRVNVCPRSAYLQRRHRKAAASHAMMRGTLVHLFAAELMVELMRRGERSLLPEGADPATAGKDVAAMTGAMVEAIADAHPELVLRAADMDAARVCAYHLAVGHTVDPATVVAVEQKFLLELEGATLSGIVDLAAFPDPVSAVVLDYKTTLGVQTQDEYRDSFQTKLYALMLVKGRPVLEEPDCHACDGTGVERDHGLGELCPVCKGARRSVVLGEPIGSHLTSIETREVYPRVKLRPDGTLVDRRHTLSRGELTEFEGDVARLVRRADAAFESGEWPAVSGSWCTECACEPECPIPSHLRRFAGSLQTIEQAAEALAWAERQAERVAATRKEVRELARSLGEPVVVGDQRWDFETRHSVEIVKAAGRSQWEGLQFAVEQAVQYGSPFDVHDWLKTKTTTTFAKRKVEKENDDGRRDAGSGDDARVGGDERSVGERWGDDAPF